jgi:hypothetical protein
VQRLVDRGIVQPSRCWGAPFALSLTTREHGGQAGGCRSCAFYCECWLWRLRSGTVDVGDFWKLVVGGVVTLCSGVLLLQLQLGGRKRRRRRDIKEQLELLALLGEYPAVAARIRRRAEVALEQYEPPMRVSQERREFWLSRGSLGFAMVLALVVYRVVGLDGPVALVGASVGGAAFAVALESWLMRKLQMREQDQAVDQVEADLTGGGALSAEAQVVEPADKADKKTNPF